MTKDEIRRMSNEDLVGRFVSCVGADYKTDYSPRVFPVFSDDTCEFWGEIEKRMSGVVTIGFDRSFFEKTMYDETKNQKDIIDSGPDHSTSYHVGIRSGLNMAFNIAMESMKVEQEEEGKE